MVVKMVKPFFKLLKEINVTFGNIILFSNILAAIIVFLAIYLVLALIDFYPIVAVIPAVFFLVVDTYIRMRKKHYREVERAYPELNEKLRTAADNLYMESPIVDELQREVIGDARHVRIGAFVNQKSTSYKILACVILCFAILFTSIFNIGFDIKLLIEKSGDYGYNLGAGNQTIAGDYGEERAAGGGDSDEIFGDPEVAELGQELFDFSISASGFEINLDDVKEVERKEFQELFPGTDSIFTSSSVYEENIPKEQQLLVKNYFKKITE